jgi:hypothetical protein
MSQQSSTNKSSIVVVYKLGEYKFLVTDEYPGNDCTREELDTHLRHIQWVQLHPVYYISELRNADTYTIEDTVIEYMSKYGINSTRGTIKTYENPIFTEEQLRIIQEKIDAYTAQQMHVSHTVVKKPQHYTRSSHSNRFTYINKKKDSMNPALYHIGYD